MPGDLSPIYIWLTKMGLFAIDNHENLFEHKRLPNCLRYQININKPPSFKLVLSSTSFNYSVHLCLQLRYNPLACERAFKPSCLEHLDKDSPWVATGKWQ